jgi:signal transduction histidine kinase
VLKTVLVPGESFLESCKTYVRFDDRSSAVLRELHPAAKPHFDRIVADFYDTITAHPSARAAITGGEAQIERLKQTLVRWMDELLAGPHDEAYAERRARIGRVHVRIGLPQAFMFTAMDRIRLHLLDVVRTHAASEDRRWEISRAVNQILDIELAIMLETYRDERHKQVVEAVPAFVLALDPEGNIALWNRQLEKVTGYDRNEMLGKPSNGLIKGDGVRVLPVKGGGERMVQWERAQVPVSDQGVWTYAVGTDVTAEQEMLRRTLRAERLAAVGTLAAGLAHEVRNPLNSALLQLQVLERRLERPETKPESLRPVAKLVADEIRRLEHLVNDFLSFVRPRPLELRPMDLSDLCRGVFELVRPEAESVKVGLVLNVPADLPPLSADAERLRQVLINLVRNAMEAMPKGGTLTMGARAVGGHIELDVEDTGVGFADEAPVFDAFFTTKETGTGLGLSIVHRVITDHGGTVRVKSRPGHTCFTLSLPGPGGTAVTQPT